MKWWELVLTLVRAFGWVLGIGAIFFLAPLYTRYVSLYLTPKGTFDDNVASTLSVQLAMLQLGLTAFGISIAVLAIFGFKIIKEEAVKVAEEKADEVAEKKAGKVAEKKAGKVAEKKADKVAKEVAGKVAKEVAGKVAKEVAGKVAKEVRASTQFKDYSDDDIPF